MTETQYENFMVFEMNETGERERLKVEEAELQSILHPEQVIVIVKEEIRRIFIWKGAKSPVRKRFISSRVANKLQSELVKEAAYHRCKIVSVDQGDEPVEFLRSFNLESMEVKERLADMRYVRNIDKDPTKARGRVVTDSDNATSSEPEEYYSPALEELKRSGKGIQPKQPSQSSHPMGSRYGSSKHRFQSSPSTRTPYKSPSKVNSKEIIDKMMKTELPEGYMRQNFIINRNLYGEISKVTNIFGEDVEEKIWEEVKPPKGVHDLMNYMFRIYLNKNQGLIKGIEILKPENSKNQSKIKKTSIELADSDKPLKEKILEVDPPQEYIREHLIVGQKLYGTVSKKAEVFGEDQEVAEWTLIKKVPKDIIMLKDHLFRVFFNEKEKQIDAIEVLKRSDNVKKSNISSQNTPSKGKEQKDQEINKDQSPENSLEKKERELPEIPSKKD
jgi:hypothetical protein